MCKKDEMKKQEQGGVVFAGQILTDPIDKKNRMKRWNEQNARDYKLSGDDAPMSAHKIKMLSRSKDTGGDALGLYGPSSNTALYARKKSAERGREKAMQAKRANFEEKEIDTHYPQLDQCLDDYALLLADIPESLEELKCLVLGKIKASSVMPRDMFDNLIECLS